MPKHGIPLGDPEPGSLCEKCGLHQATVNFAGTASMFELNHGYPYQEWCECCFLRKTITYSEGEVARLQVHLAEAREKLRVLTCDAPVIQSELPSHRHARTLNGNIVAHRQMHSPAKGKGHDAYIREEKQRVSRCTEQAVRAFRRKRDAKKAKEKERHGTVGFEALHDHTGYSPPV